MKLFALTLLIALGLASATTPEGKAWLASNLEKEGVKATDSGLQYKIIKSGEDGAPSVAYHAHVPSFSRDCAPC